MNIIYRIWYSLKPTEDDPETEFIAYIGRTKNDLTQRLRNHFFKHPFQRMIEIGAVSHIDYAEFQMNVCERKRNDDKRRTK